MPQTFLTIAIPFKSENLARVDEILAVQGKLALKGGSIRERLRGQGVHFLSITTVPGGPKHSAYLVIESSHDDVKQSAVECIANKLDSVLKAVFQAAEIDTAGGDVAGFLDRNSIETGQNLLSTPGVSHVGVPGMTVERIKAEHDFANAVRDTLAEHRTEATPLNTLIAVRKKLGGEARHTSMMKPEDVAFLAPEPEKMGALSLIVTLAFRGVVTFGWPYLIVVGLLMLFIGYQASLSGSYFFVAGMVALTLLIATVVLVLGVAFLFTRLRSKERTDKPDDSTPDFDVLTKVMEIENDGDNNHLAGISVMKPGLLRNMTLRLAFWVIGQMAQLQFKSGFLSDLGTIHFARWVLLPGTDKLLFFSNYSGSWESYLEDFVTKASGGLTGVWSNTYGYPRTEALFQRGAEDGDRFKRWARRQQRPSLFWYRAYPNKTTRLIRLNAAIRHGLLSASTQDQANDWLALFGSRRRKPSSIETDEVQSIVFSGMRNLRDATVYLLRLPVDREKARQWLAGVEPNISFNDRPLMGSAQIIAFTSSGLARLGLVQDYLREFPAAFQQGMSDPRRAEFVLKDTGDDAPKKWGWGYGEKTVDAALIIYSEVKESSSTQELYSKKPLDLLTALGGAVVDQIDTRRLPKTGPVREAFGFVDGVSQPIIRGTHRWQKDKASQHVVEPGEILLGYPDNRGFLPTTPTIPSAGDPGNMLPAHHEIAIDHDWPPYPEASASRRRDLGRNGSYLVIRQLQQDVDQFNQRIANLAKTFANHPGKPANLEQWQLEIWLKAKVVGRWPDGTSLVRHPFEPGSGWNGDREPEVKADNSFLLGSEDPEGLRCPFSAHIRRTNPRESFAPGSAEQLDIVNRHRILRVGRPYGLDGDTNSANDEPRGLVFMCLNGDLERQFEFIQQTWVMSRLFHGLSGEVDAILGRGHGGGQLTIPTDHGPVVVQGFNDFVTVRGGAYFFLPGRSTLRYLCRMGGAGG